jgi:hypothetical protein
MKIQIVFTSAEVVPGVSDHDALIATLSVSSVLPSSAPREVDNFDKVDWKGLNRALATGLRPVLQQNDLDVGNSSPRKKLADQKTVCRGWTIT